MDRHNSRNVIHNSAFNNNESVKSLAGFHSARNPTNHILVNHGSVRYLDSQVDLLKEENFEKGNGTPSVKKGLHHLRDLLRMSNDSNNSSGEESMTRPSVN